MTASVTVGPDYCDGNDTGRNSKTITTITTIIIIGLIIIVIIVIISSDNDKYMFSIRHTSICTGIGLYKVKKVT